MGFKFRKSIKIAPGVKLNLNKKSTGITFGGKGFHYTMNSKGKRTTSVGIPGTGLSYSTTSSKKSKKGEDEVFMNNNEGTITEKNPKKKKKGCLTAIILCFLFVIGIGSCGGDDSSDIEESTSVTTAVNAIAPTNTTTQKENSTTEKESTTQKQSTTEKDTTTEKQTTAKKETTTQKQATTKKPATTKKETTTKKTTTTKKSTTKRDNVDDQFNGRTVYITPNGKRYHYDPDCGGENSYEVSINSVGGRTACKKCAQ